MKEWEIFEIAVANYFRQKGATASRNVPIAGSQIDVLIEESTASGQLIKSIVECKDFSRPVGVDAVRQFAGVAQSLIMSRTVDKAIIVSKSGYTREARAAAEAFEIRLLEFDELRFDKSTPNLRDIRNSRVGSIETDDSGNASKRRTAFVAMPFSEEFYDVYVFGIVGACAEVGFSAIRIDEFQYGGSIIEQIHEQIERAFLVIADITHSNPNVFYEIGYAQALRKTIIFACRAGQQIPFDVASFRCLTYKSIADLKEKLTSFLRSLNQ
jgi:hypothetical protein